MVFGDILFPLEIIVALPPKVTAPDNVVCLPKFLMAPLLLRPVPAILNGSVMVYAPLSIKIVPPFTIVFPVTLDPNAFAFATFKIP